MSDEHTKAEEALKRIEQLGGFYVWEPELCVVSFDNPDVDDDAVRMLVDIPAIQILNLKNTHVTDAVFNYLEQLPKLEKVMLMNTQITKAGIDRFKAARPTIEVTTESPKGVNPFTGESM